MRMDLGGQSDVSAPLPWQGTFWMRLKQQLDDGKLPHALLLSGSQDTGKARLALALARLLLCASPSGGLNCGKCHACELSASGSHGDLCWLQPEEKSRVIKIDQVRRAVSFAQQTASFGTRKVMVLYPADTMNSNAANALLKALEEPSPDTYMILVCHRLHGVPATIRSRCQIMKLQPPEEAECLPWLDSLTGERSQSESLLQLARGRPMLAERLCRDNNIESTHSIQQALTGVLCGLVPVSEVAHLFSDVDTGGFLAHLQQSLQQLVRSQSGSILRTREGQSAFRLDAELTRLRAAVEAGANPNPQLMVESMLSRGQRELGGALLSDTMKQHQGRPGQ